MFMVAEDGNTGTSELLSTTSAIDYYILSLCKRVGDEGDQKGRVILEGKSFGGERKM